jgi:hypothetical protein
MVCECEIPLPLAVTVKVYAPGARPEFGVIVIRIGSGVLKRTNPGPVWPGRLKVALSPAGLLVAERLTDVLKPLSGVRVMVAEPEGGLIVWAETLAEMLKSGGAGTLMESVCE